MSNERFWRVYRSEWCVVYISDTDGEEGQRECARKFDEAYAGRVRPEEGRVVPWSPDRPEWWPWMLEIHLPAMKGEYSSRPLALEHARKICGEVVLEGSRSDKRLLGYGKWMLRKEHGASPELDDAGAAGGAPGQEG